MFQVFANMSPLPKPAEQGRREPHLPNEDTKQRNPLYQQVLSPCEPGSVLGWGLGGGKKSPFQLSSLYAWIAMDKHQLWEDHFMISEEEKRQRLERQRDAVECIATSQTRMAASPRERTLALHEADGGR